MQSEKLTPSNLIIIDVDELKESVIQFNATETQEKKVENTDFDNSFLNSDL